MTSPSVKRDDARTTQPRACLPRRCVRDGDGRSRAALDARAELASTSWLPAGRRGARAIRAIAGPLAERESRLRAEGEVLKEDGRFHLRLVVHVGQLVGERSIVSDSCEIWRVPPR